MLSEAKMLGMTVMKPSALHGGMTYLPDHYRFGAQKSIYVALVKEVLLRCALADLQQACRMHVTTVAAFSVPNPSIFFRINDLLASEDL